MRQRFGLREVDIADIREKFKDKNYMFRKDYNQIKDIESDIALIQEGMTSEDSWVEPNIVIGGVGFGNPNYGKMIEEVHDIKHDENYQINIDEERLVDEIYNQGSRPGNRIGMPAYDRPSKDDIREMIRSSKKDKDSLKMTLIIMIRQRKILCLITQSYLKMVNVNINGLKHLQMDQEKEDWLSFM